MFSISLLINFYYNNDLKGQILYEYRFSDRILRPGIDPGPLAWKASMQPLTLTEQVFPLNNLSIFWELYFYLFSAYKN